jgi:hypothetical protein
MDNDATRLHGFNARIREATAKGAVEDMINLIEERRQFLDILSKTDMVRPPALIAALDEAVRDNMLLVSGLENEMKQARLRGKGTLQARRRYHKTQINP